MLQANNTAFSYFLANKRQAIIELARAIMDEDPIPIDPNRIPNSLYIVLGHPEPTTIKYYMIDKKLRIQSLDAVEVDDQPDLKKLRAVIDGESCNVKKIYYSAY